MKKIFTTLAILFAGLSAFAQNINISDKSTLQGIPQITISSSTLNTSVITNEQGLADITAFKSANDIIIQHTSYENKSYTYMELEQSNFELYLSERSYSLDEVVFSASKFEEKRIDVPQQVQILKAKDLAFMNQQTLANIMEQSGNVLVQKSQMGGGSPVIRGFEANKVLMVVDGVRMNNAIYRGGHLQNIITMDNSILDKVETVFGPGSVVYGSDALGGVMHFHTKNPNLSDDSGILFQANAFARYSSAYNERSGHIDFNVGFRKLAFLTSFTYSQFGDLMQGGNRNPAYGDWGKRFFYAERINGVDVQQVNDNPNIQKQTGYTQYDFLEKIRFQQSDRVSHTLNFQFSNSSDVPRYDRLSERGSTGVLSQAQWYYGPQKRLFGSYTLDLKDSPIYDNARIILAYQDIEESRHNRRFGSTNLQHRIENIKVYSLNADFNKNIGERHELRYGLEFTYNQLTSTAYSENVNTGVTGLLDTRYPDGGSNYRSLAGYLTHTFEISEKWILTEGIRYSNVALSAKFVEKGIFPFPFNEANQNAGALNGNIGLIFMPTLNWRFALTGSSGFRAPNIDDLAKVFESIVGTVATAGRLVVPNPNLKPEYTYNGELSISKIFADKVRLEAIGYYTIYQNAITTQSFTFNGASSINYGGFNSNIVASQNSSEAYIYGINVNLSADITKEFSIVSTINYTYGRIKNAAGDIPLDHIPPVFGKTSFNLNLKKFRSEFFVLYNGWKDIKDYNPNGEDNQIYATQYGMPEWYTLNLRAAYQVNQYAQLQVAVENILDQNYRVFASGISGAGRNLIVTIRGRF